MSLASGRFISLEGGEGSGKSTQSRRLLDGLRARGIDVRATREPGGSPGAEAVRAVLLSGAAEALGTQAEALLFAAARADHVAQTIQPALQAGCWVVCDRFIDSTRVYQGAVGKVPPDLLGALERVATQGLRPDLTVILDIDPKIGLQRAAARANGAVADRFEKQGLPYHQAVRDAFLALAQSEPERCVVVNAGDPPEVVAGHIARAVRDRLGVDLVGQPE